MTANLGRPDDAPTAAHVTGPDGENTVIKQVTADGPDPAPPRPPRKILARTLCQALHAAGVIPGDLSHIARVVLDLEPNRAAVLYVDYYADERWLDVVRTLDGVDVVTRPPAAS